MVKYIVSLSPVFLFTNYYYLSVNKKSLIFSQNKNITHYHNKTKLLTNIPKPVTKVRKCLTNEKSLNNYFFFTIGNLLNCRILERSE